MANKNGSNEHFELYKLYSTALRNWIVAFGVGGVAIFVSNAKAFSNATCDAKFAICTLFAIASGAQISLALINKYSNLYLSEGKNKRMLAFCTWLSEQIVIDFALDLISVVLFAVASYKLIGIICNSTTSGS
jgi:hypothetical protein